MAHFCSVCPNVGRKNWHPAGKKKWFIPFLLFSANKCKWAFCCCCSTMLSNYWFEWFFRLKIKFLIEYKWVWKISKWQSFSLLTFIRIKMFPNWSSYSVAISFKILYVHVLWEGALGFYFVWLGSSIRMYKYVKIPTEQIFIKLTTLFLGYSSETSHQHDNSRHKIFGFKYI